MSFNEMMWWQAYACCRPLEPNRLDIMEARLLSAWSKNSNGDALLKKWFRKEDDAEWCKQRDEATKKRLRARKKALMEKLAKEEAEKKKQELEAKN